MYESMKDNLNAEKWNEEKAIKLFEDSIEKAKQKENYVIGSGQNSFTVKGYSFHFIGEVVAEFDLYSDLYLYLKKKYPSCELLYKMLKTRLEQNCFSDSKKGIIKEATAIVNLKANYGWSDRVETVNTHNIKSIEPITWVNSDDKDK